MSESSTSRITELLQASVEGDEHAANELLPIVYQELRRMAQAQINHERPGHTLSATALVHEVYLKLVGQDSAGWKSRADFYGVAAKAMRRILIDHARAKRARKRGGSAARVPLDDEIAWFEKRDIELVELDVALNRLGELDPEKSRIVELRFFAGLTVRQVADVLNTSLRSVEREWTHAKAWLRTQLRKQHK